jgi:serine/threonine kinase 3
VEAAHDSEQRVVALKEEHVDGIMQMMQEGCCFTGYFEYQGEAVKQEFLVLYRPHPWPGALYWCEPDNAVENGDCCLSLSMVEDMYLGKHTKVFLSETAGDAPADRCFSIFSKDKTHVNFEARSAELRSSWVQGITHILATSGMKIIESMQEVNAKGGKRDSNERLSSSERFSSSDSDDNKRHNGGSSSGSSTRQSQGRSSAASSSLSISASGKSSKLSSRNAGRSKKGSSRNSVGPRLRERRSNMQPIDEEDRQKNHRKISFVLNKDKSGMSRYKIAEEDPTVIFQLISKMGQGSYGSVFTARDKRDDSLVAIKVLQVEEGAPLHKLKAEIHTLRKCHSKYIVAYKGTFHKNNEIWIVMEHCNVGSLCDLMAITDRTLTEEQIAAVLHMSLLGLEYLHVQRKIHRDIKCGNILVSKEGVCKLADFGVSAQLTHTCSKRRTVIGTPYWMAPEVLDTSAEYDGKADIWSLAITAIEMAQGDPPHSDLHPMRAIFVIPGSPPPLLSEPDKWSKDFKDFLTVCLQKNPDDRPSARRLLSHQFIVKAKQADGPSVIQKLVAQSMREIDAYRAMETSMHSAEAQDYSEVQGYSEVKREVVEEYSIPNSLDSPVSTMPTETELVVSPLDEAVKSPENSLVRSDDGEQDVEERVNQGEDGYELQTAYSASFRAKKIKERRAALRRLEASSLSLGAAVPGPVLDSSFAGSSLVQSPSKGTSEPSPNSLLQSSSMLRSPSFGSTPSSPPSSHRGGRAQLAAADDSRRLRAKAVPASTIARSKDKTTKPD